MHVLPFTILQSGVLLIKQHAVLERQWDLSFHPSGAPFISVCDEHCEPRVHRYRNDNIILPVSQNYLEDQIKSSKNLIRCQGLQNFMVANYENTIISKGYDSSLKNKNR